MTISNDKRNAKRRTLGLLSAAAVGALTVGLPNLASAQTKGVLRIGYQKYGTLVILKGRGTLEKRLAPEGIEVKWNEFTACPVLLEGLNVGFGTAGEAPPILHRLLAPILFMSVTNHQHQLLKRSSFLKIRH